MNINEIAKLAGVSRATVSRYLNNGYVSEEKKELIQKVIEETGYRPSGFAQTMRNKRTNYIGVIIPKIDSVSIARMIKGISETLTANNYQLLLACTNNNEKEELKYLDLFKENHVDGIILFGTIFSKEHQRHLSQLCVPIVILGQYLENYTCIYHDDYSAAKSITALLTPTAKNWGYIGVTEADEAVGRKRKAGFLDCLAECDQSIADDCIVSGEFTAQSGYESAKELLARHPEIDSLLCATDTIAAGALKRICELKLKIPEDVQLAGFGDSTISGIMTPTLATVHFHYKTAGIEAAKLLLERIQASGQSIQKQIQLGYQVIVNESIRKK